MRLLYKPDWEETKERFRAWWAHEYFGRCAIRVTAPRDDVPAEAPPRLPDKLEDRWLDLDYLAEVNEYRMRHTFYGGEALPVWNPGYPGCDSHVAYLGAEVHLAEETGWVTPFLDHGELTSHDFHDLTLAAENRWRRFGRDLRRFCVERSRGRSLPSNFAFGGCGDTLAAIRSTELLLTDLMDCPEHVRDFELHLMRQWIEIYEDSYRITSEGAEGSTCWFELWSPGRFYAVQNDFSYMISPAMFNDIFLPSVELQTRYLDHAVYHADGIGSFVHLDALLELPRLQAFQILPGAGKPGPLSYPEVLRKVQGHGRNLHISIPACEVKAALDLLSARGLFIDTRCDSETDARRLLESVTKWSEDR